MTFSDWQPELPGIEPRHVATTPRPFSEFQEQGLLWLFNRVYFHPLGYALTFHYDEENFLEGWSLQGDGSELWAFDMETDDAGFAKVKAFFESLVPPAA